MKGTVVIISSIHWHSTWQRHQDIAGGLAENGYAVTFVEPLPKRWPGPGEWRRVVGRLTGSAAAAGVCRQPEPEGVTIVSPRALPDVGKIGRGLNAGYFVPRLAERLAVTPAQRPLIVINYLPTPASLALQQHLQPDLAIYDCVVDWDNAPFTASLAQFEAQLLQHADLVFADSPFLFAKMAARHRNVVEVLPAVHLERFLLPQRAPAAAGDGRPLCVYFGTLGASVDVDLICAVSKMARLRLIGPVRTAMPCLSADTDLRGTVPHAAVPGLIQDADVLLLPYLDAPHMPAVIPAKTFECLATGIPTVAIGVPSLAQFDDLFYLADSHDAFLELIGTAATEPAARRAPRIACARENSWEARMAEIDGFIQRGLREKTAGANPPGGPA